MATSTEEQLVEFSKLQREDHDVTIRIDEQLRGFIQENRQTNANTTKTLADHEARIIVLERKDEVDKGIKVERNTNKRNIIEIITVAALIISAVGTWALSRK